MTPATALVQPTAPGYTTVELDPALERDAIIDVDRWAFAEGLSADLLQAWDFPAEAGRTVGVRHGEDLVAVHSSLASDITVPGGTLPAAGLTWVGVHPGHRRRGLATAMLATHLQRTAQRGEPLSALFAAEAEIYGRYGYGLSATHLEASIPRGTHLRPVPGTETLTCSLERADVERHRDLVADLTHRAARPGHLTMHEPAQVNNLFTDPPGARNGAEARRIAVVRDESGQPRAFALFRRAMDWSPTGPNGTVRITHWASLDAAAGKLLIESLCDLDLMAKTTLGYLPPDAPLFRQLVNLRAADLRVVDNLWLRIVDLPAALAGRTYAAPFEVVLEVSDTMLPANAGRWHVVGGPAGAHVSRIESGQHAGDGGAILIGIADLSSAYLGGVTLASLANAGLISAGDRAALAAASAAFATPLAPACSWMF